MGIAFFFQGLAIGFAIAAPVGPIGVLCIQRTLAEGYVSGLISGLGAATADALYGCVAGFGLTFIAHFMMNQTGWLRLAGGLFLCYLGIKTFCSKPAEPAITVKRSNLVRAYISTFFLTLTNPMTILSFVAVFAGLGLANARGNYSSAGFLVLGVFMGSALWWLILSKSVGFFRGKFRSQWMVRIHQASGLILAAFGVISLLSSLS